MPGVNSNIKYSHLGVSVRNKKLVLDNLVI